MATTYHAVYAMQVHVYKSFSTGITKAFRTHGPSVTMPSSSQLQHF